jgi:hypothetical protein
MVYEAVVIESSRLSTRHGREEIEMGFRILGVLRILRGGVIVLFVFGAFHGRARAGDRAPVHWGNRHLDLRINENDPHRKQRDLVRDGLGPGLLPYVRKGHLWGSWNPHYPAYPWINSPVPVGPRDELYETGRFPWQRG